MSQNNNINIIIIIIILMIIFYSPVATCNEGLYYYTYVCPGEELINLCF